MAGETVSDAALTVKEEMDRVMKRSLDYIVFEMSESKFKLIHSYLKTIMAQERLCNLAFLIVEREVTEITDLENNIDMFASRKVSNVQL
ncbi:unnamed protein product [Parnassius mnemosyne]|uniref:Uncharacterized protein n=1 Tax=Parnassius mnemosyne TaxID=213953 RepID=A0AAV1LZZ8_9NEOP